jgi:photosystem II stability/assembly factor-like uncharacterized protein
LAAVLLVAVAVGHAQVFHGVAVAPDGLGAWTVAIDTIAVYYTPDFGENWEWQTFMTIRNLFDVCCIDPQNAWTCGMTGDVWHTSDGGVNWARQNLGGPKHAARIRFLDAQFGWAAGGDQVQLSTTNGGEEWNQKMLPNPPFPGDTCEFNGVSFVTPQMGWIVAGRWPVADTFAGGQGYVARTRDRGDNWELQRRDTTYDYYDCWFADTLTGCVVGGDDRDFRAVVLRTTDGGVSWTPATVPSGARFLRSAYFVSPDEGWACGRSGTIIHTTDAGQTWASQTTGVDTTLFDIEFADGLRGMAAGNSVVLSTTDGGLTWNRCFGGVAEALAVPTRSGLRLSSSPARRRVAFDVAGAGPYLLTIHDMNGRVVRTLTGRAGGTQRLVWDGAGEDGAAVRSGLFVARLVCGRESSSLRFAYLE